MSAKRLCIQLNIAFPMTYKIKAPSTFFEIRVLSFLSNAISYNKGPFIVLYCSRYSFLNQKGNHQLLKKSSCLCKLTFFTRELVILLLVVSVFSKNVRKQATHIHERQHIINWWVTITSRQTEVNAETSWTRCTGCHLSSRRPSNHQNLFTLECN